MASDTFDKHTHPNSWNKWQQLQQLKLEVIDQNAPWSENIEIKGKPQPHIKLDNVNHQKLLNDLHEIFPDNKFAYKESYANRLYTNLIGKDLWQDDLPNTHAGLSPDDYFTGAILRKWSEDPQFDSKTGKLSIEPTHDLLHHIAVAADETPPVNNNALSDTSGRKGMVWGNTYYDISIIAPTGDHYFVSFPHNPVIGARGYMHGSAEFTTQGGIVGEIKSAPKAKDGESADTYFANVKPTNKESDLTVFVVDQMSPLKPYKAEEKPSLEANDSPYKKVLVTIADQQYAVKPEEVSDIRMIHGKPMIFNTPKVVFVDKQNEQAVMTAKKIFGHTYIVDPDKPVTDPDKKIGGILQFNSSADFNGWFQNGDKQRLAGDYLTAHPQAGKYYVLDKTFNPKEEKVPDQLGYFSNKDNDLTQRLDLVTPTQRKWLETYSKMDDTQKTHLIQQMLEDQLAINNNPPAEVSR